MFLALKLFLSGVPAWAWRWLAIAALGIALVAFGWVKGNQYGTEKLTDYKAAQALESSKIIVKQGAVTERIVTQYIERQAKTQAVTQTIQNEVTRYVETAPRLVLDSDWVRLHNAAARAIPDSPKGTDGAPGEVTAAQALPVITGNYGACQRNADRLEALQAWVREQAAVK